MFCQQCGNKIEDSALFCPGCGQKVVVNSVSQTNPVPEVQSSPFVATPAPEVQSSPFMTTPAPEVQSSPFMTTPAPEVQSSPFMNAPAPEVQSSPFMATPAPEVQSSPFMATPAPEVQSSPFMATPAPEVVPSVDSPVNPFGNGNNQQTKFDAKKNVSEIKKTAEKKNEKKPGNKGSDEKSSSNIFIMVFAQIIFVAFICYMGITGKLNNSLGEINLAYTVVLLLVIMALNLVLYAVLFMGGKKKNPIAVPPPIERPKTDTRKAPAYMSEVIKSNNTGIPGIEPVEEDDCPTEVCLPEENFDDGEATVVIDIPAVKYPKLEYIEDNVKKEILINKDEFIIGRLRGRVDFITTNKKIGRIHAAIVTRDGSYFVKDFNSQNKTYINRGGAIAPEQEYAIKDNDVISFADSEFTFKLPE